MLLKVAAASAVVRKEASQTCQEAALTVQAGAGDGAWRRQALAAPH